MYFMGRRYFSVFFLPKRKHGFVTKDVPYDPRGGNNLVLPKARTNLYGIVTIRFIGQNLWQTFPNEMKESQSLEIFKKKY